MLALYILLLLGSLLVGLTMLAMGVVLLLKMKNKIAGLIVGAVGLVFTLFPVAAFLFLATIRSLG